MAGDPSLEPLGVGQQQQPQPQPQPPQQQQQPEQQHHRQPKAPGASPPAPSPAAADASDAAPVAASASPAASAVSRPGTPVTGPDLSKLGHQELRSTALSGVRFGALSGAGPSGMRPEHLQSALLTSRRSVSARLLRAIAALVLAAKQGNLPAKSHWLTQSRLVYLRKPDTETPRPIRVGEVWRRLIGKRILADHRDDLEELFLRARQCGVLVPGGCDVLVHLRRCLDAALQESDEPYVVLDLDLRNAFPSLHWSAVRAAVDAHVPTLGPWTHWCHQSAAQILLPDGTWYSCDRGAEQGDPLGPVYCALALLGPAEAARSAAGCEVWDGWFMDDGQVLVQPAGVSKYLSTFDAELAAIGGTRVSEGAFKSTAYLCSNRPLDSTVSEEWQSAAGATCKILSGPPAKVLGVGIEADSASAQFSTACASVAAACRALPDVNDPAVELALLRISTNVCRVNHLLRALGPTVPLADILGLDETIEQSLGTTLGGPIRGLALERASLGARDGGLGLRRAREVQLPAFLASRTESRALATDLAGSLPAKLQASLFAVWDMEVATALTAWQDELGAGTSAVAVQMLAAGASRARRRAWQMAGEVPSGGAPASLSREHLELSVLSPVGAEDPECPASAFYNLQTQLCDLASGAMFASVRAQYAAREDGWPDVRMLDDLSDRATDHTWMWLFAASGGPRISKSDFCTAVRLRIGADVVPPEHVCACCGEVMGADGKHALRCAPGESTRGHYSVTSVVHVLASLSDPASCAEPRGLVPSRPALRPADVLTSAAFSHLAALDVCVASPDAEGAGTDACAAGAVRKTAHYKDVIEELQDEGYTYHPLVWSSWGRPGHDAESAVRTLAAAVARRRGLGDGHALEARAKGLIGAAIWRRAAAMVRTCLRRPTQADASELLPACEDIGSEDGFLEDIADAGPLPSPAPPGVAAAGAPAAAAAAAGAA